MPSDYDRIRADNILEYGQGTRHLSFLGRLYTDRTHFVFELLQNAEDAGASRILFMLFHDRLEVSHDGRPFNELDVRGVCGVGEGAKAEDLTQIGRFGIGFKSVYAYTSKPEVHSGDESFRIEKYVRPNAVEQRRAGDSWTTLFVFPFNAEDIDPETARREIGSRLRNLSARTLLFLRKIIEIEYKLPDLPGGVYLREEIPRDPARQITVIGQNNDEDEDENWLIFERSVQVPDGSDQVRVEIGFRLETRAKEEAEDITRIKHAPLVVYFPTEKDTRFGFLIQGPYKTTASRDNIPKDDDWNETLIRETACLLADVLPHLKQLGLLTVSLLEALPIRMDDFPEDSMFYPIVVAVREALMNEELLPATDGTFVAARDAKLASAEWLRGLIQQEQLRQLFKTQTNLKWISGEITDRAKYELWNYLHVELNVEVLNPDGFARRLDRHFLKRQSNAWMICFYTELLGQKALWKKGSNYWPYNPGPLRGKPFIRLQNGQHVEPFRKDGSPNAFLAVGADIDTTLPIVKVELSQDEKAFQFLSELGIPELDLVEEVIERTLPKYTNGSAIVSVEEHVGDIRKIERAYETDSKEKKERLRERLHETPFILAENPGKKGTSYKKPCEVYFGTDKLRMYFSGNESYASVSHDYDKSTMMIFKDLGVTKTVRTRRKESNGKGFVSITGIFGCHERGLSGFDPDIWVDGLEYAIIDSTLERSEFIWNNIAIQYAECIRGVVEKSTRQTYENSTKEEQISKFGQLLIDNAWLPALDGSMHRPSDLTLGDLPESFSRNESLARQLGMKMDVVAALAEEAGVTAEDIELLRQHPEEFKQWKDRIKAIKDKPTFPTRTAVNPDRRKERIAEQLGDSPEKEYEPRRRSVRVTVATEYTHVWLKEQYSNDNGQLVCQICKKEMPFKKRDGEYYFEAVEALSKEYFSREHEAQFLALCPLCAAMYKEFIKKDEKAMADLRYALINTNEFEVPLRLGDLDKSIRFVETHYNDVKTILEERE